MTYTDFIRILFKVFFWGFNLLVTMKFGIFSFEWYQTNPEDREPYWDYILKEVFIGRWFF